MHGNAHVGILDSPAALLELEYIAHAPKQGFGGRLGDVLSAWLERRPGMKAEGADAN